MERKRSVRRRRKAPFAERAKDHCRKFTAFMFSNVGIILLVVLYTTAGAFMFISIEGGQATERTAGIARTRNTVAAHLWNISCCEANIFNKTYFVELVDKEIRNYQQQVVKAARGGYPGTSEGGLKGGTQWTMSGAFLYSLTVITTIGYGNISPRTDWGKVATIFYAIIGMPLFLLYLSNIGDILAKSFKWIYAKLCLCRVCPGVAKRRAHRERRKQRAQPDDNVSYRKSIEDGDEFDDSSATTTTPTVLDDSDAEGEIGDGTETVTVPLTICVMIMIGYILFGATLFARWEDWDSLDGSYFCFISLSSIGFGDIVPGDQLIMGGEDGNVVGLSFILCAVYLLLGMALIAMCFNLMQEQVIHKIQSFKRCIRRCFRCDR